ncbi:MAG: DUF362 domain-containing protein [Thermoguttaceae bacterium]|jgi:uncharacterized protein (DUF362 family)
MGMHTRRDFLVHSAAAAGAMALGAQGRFARAAEKTTEMAIARWAGAAGPEAAAAERIAASLTEKAIEGLGGMARFVKRGDVVWVKPNIGWDRTPEQAANTNPAVVAALVRMCFDAGAKVVKVGDNTCNAAAKCYHASGIAAAAKELGAQVLFMDRSRVREVAIKGERVKTLPMFPEMLECDLLINVPVVKHHVIAGVTLCMKNYMGVIEKRNTFHQAMGDCLADLTRFMKPRLCVLDAVRILKAHGPQGGNPADVEIKNTVAAGVDIVALDALGAELMGKKPADFSSIVKGQAAGLGKIDYRSLALKELAVS